MITQHVGAPFDFQAFVNPVNHLDRVEKERGANDDAHAANDGQQDNKILERDLR